MKQLSLLVLIAVLSACNKQDVVLPKQNVTVAVNYKDDYISVKDFQAANDSTGESSIIVSFTTLYEKDIQKIEVMKGNTENNLCATYVIKLNLQSFQSKFYSYVDKSENRKATYFMLKYTLNNNNWGYTPVYKFQSK